MFNQYRQQVKQLLSEVEYSYRAGIKGGVRQCCNIIFYHAVGHVDIIHQEAKYHIEHYLWGETTYVDF